MSVRTMEGPPQTTLNLQGRGFSLITIALVSVGTTGTAYLLFPLWFLDSPQVIDAWIYWGTADSPAYAAKYFSETYYFRRWPLIGIAYVFQQFLAPLEAQAIMKGILLLFVLFLGGFLVALVTRKLSWALLVVVMLGSSEYVVRNLGSSYHQGLGVLLLVAVATLVMLLAEAKRTSHIFFAIGVGCGLMFITYQVLVYLMPALVVAAVIGAFSRRSHLLKNRELRTYVRSLILWGASLLAGFISVVWIADTVVAHILQVEWTNSIAYAVGMRDIGKDFSPDLGGNNFSIFLRPEGFQSAMAVSWVAFAVLLMTTRKWVSIQVWVWFLFFSVLSATYIGGKLLGLHFLDAWPWMNIHYLVVTIISIPILGFVATGMSFGTRSKDWVLALIISVGWVGASFWPLLWTLHSAWLLMLAVAPLITLPLAAALSKKLGPGPGRYHAWTRCSLPVLIVIGCLSIVGLMQVSMGRWLSAGWSGPPFATQAEAGSFYDELSRNHRMLTNTALENDKRMWVLDLRPHSGWSTNASALYGLYSAFALGSPPSLVSCEQFDSALSYPNSSVAVLGAVDHVHAMNTLTTLTQECNADYIAEIDSASSSDKLTWIDIAHS